MLCPAGLKPQKNPGYTTILLKQQTSELSVPKWHGTQIICTTNGLLNRVTSKLEVSPILVILLPNNLLLLANYFPGQAAWHTPAVIPALGNWGQEEHEFKITQVQASLSYIEDPASKRKRKEKRTGEERGGEGEGSWGSKDNPSQSVRT